jgi:hypothetical protein
MLFSVSFFTLAPDYRGLLRKEKKRKIALKASLVEAFFVLALETHRLLGGYSS